MKNIILILTFVFVKSISSGQTNIHGGIFSDTTWTRAGSPYIITDTVVVFPGVTLTIEPGVVVEFNDNKYIEVRQANIFAEGTPADSITFTIHSGFANARTWKLFLNNYPAHTVSKFNYCNFLYASNGLYDYGLGDSLTIRNSTFAYNEIGLEPEGGFVLIDSCNISYNLNDGIYKLSGTLSNSLITHNQTGIDSPYGIARNCIFTYNDVGILGAFLFIEGSTINYNGTGVISRDNYITLNDCIIDSNTVEGIKIPYTANIRNCEIKYNSGIGIESNGRQSSIMMCDIENNLTGIKETGDQDTIVCNNISNNSDYDFNYSNFSGGNFSIPDNYWGTTDSVAITSVIYDGNDNINFGLLNFLPVDSSQCYLQNSVAFIDNVNPAITIYPNPSSGNFIISANYLITSFQIFNPIGQNIYSRKLNSNTTSVGIYLRPGLYFLHINNREGNFCKPIIIE